MTNNPVRKVNIIGHQHPDTDSVCSALAYAWLRNHMNDGIVYEARSAGVCNRETAFVLRHFGIEAPRLCTTVSPQIKDVDIRQQPGISGETSLHACWDRMNSEEIDTLCIVDDGNHLQGLITLQDIASANMDRFDTGMLAAAGTTVQSLLDTLQATLQCGSADKVIRQGRIFIGTSPEVMEDALQPGDIVLVSNRYEVQMCAVDCDAGVLVVCAGATVNRGVQRRAEEKGCVILTSPYDTYTVSRLIGTAAPVRHFMRHENLITFNVNTSVEDAARVISGVRLHYFPILDERGRYEGVISRRNLANLHRKRVILVDHNERSQAVDGLEEAEILEIIDHHRIGGLETGSPVYFRNAPVGCTSTILFSIFREYGVTPPREIAGLMLSAILSDTLMFRSPTSTPADETAARELAVLCGEDIPAYAQAMFEAGGDLTGFTADDVFHSDFKVFSRGNVRFGVGQSSYMTQRNRLAAEALLRPYLEEARLKENLPLVFYMITDLKEEATDLLFAGEDCDEIVAEAFNCTPQDGKVHLPGVMSRKKQLIPPLMAALQNRQK